MTDIDLPIATVKVLTGVSEGFQNVPDMYGGHTRKSKKITGIGSGFKEGGKVRSLVLTSFLSHIYAGFRTWSLRWGSRLIPGAHQRRAERWSSWCAERISSRR